MTRPKDGSSIRDGKRQITAWIDPETYRALRVMAAERDLTLPRIIEELLQQMVASAK